MSSPRDNNPDFADGSLPPRLPPGRAAELADLYAVGALSPTEHAEFERRVALGEPEYVAEHRRVLSVIEMMLTGVNEIAPPAALRARLSRELEADDTPSPFTAHDHEDAGELVGAGAGIAGTSAAAAAAGIAISRLATGRWHPTGIRGVRFRSLHADRRANRRTIILQMDPGTELPDHDHTGTEEVIMISGELSIAGTVLGPGDYIKITAGADHGVPRTRNGCVCIIVSGYSPFPLASWWGFVKAAVRGWVRR